MIVNSIYSKLVQQCKDVAQVDIDSMDCAEFAKDFLNIPVIYVFSKRDEFVECADSMQIFGRLSTNFKFFIDSQAKHNEARRPEKIERVFTLFRDLKRKKDKNRRMSKARSKRKLSETTRRLKKEGSLGRSEQQAKRTFGQLQKKHMSTGNLARIREIDNEAGSGRKAGAQKGQWRPEVKKSAPKPKEKSMYQNIQRRVSRNRSQQSATKKSRSKKKSKPPRLDRTRQFSEKERNEKGKKTKKKPKKKKPRTNQSFLSDKFSDKYIQVEKTAQRPPAHSGRGPGQAQKTGTRKQGNTKATNGPETRPKEVIPRGMPKSRERKKTVGQDQFQIEIDVEDLAEKFDGLKSEIREFNLPKTKKIDFLRKTPSQARVKMAEKDKMEFPMEKTRQVQTNYNNHLFTENKTHWKMKPNTSIRQNEPELYVQTGPIPKGHSQEPMYISIQSDDKSPTELNKKAKLDQAKRPNLRAQTSKAKIGRISDTKQKPLRQKSASRDERPIIKNESTFKVIKYSTRTTTVASQSESIQDRLSRNEGHLVTTDPSRAFGKPQAPAKAFVKQRKSKDHQPKHFAEKLPNSQRQAQILGTKSRQKEAGRGKKKRVLITQNSGRNVEPKVTISHQSSTRENAERKKTKTPKMAEESKESSRKNEGRFDKNVNEKLIANHQIFENKGGFGLQYANGRYYTTNYEYPVGKVLDQQQRRDLENLKQKVLKRNPSKLQLEHDLLATPAHNKILFKYKDYTNMSAGRKNSVQYGKMQTSADLRGNQFFECKCQ